MRSVVAMDAMQATAVGADAAGVLPLPPRHRVAAKLAAPRGTALPWGWRGDGQRAAYLLMGRAGDGAHGTRYGLFTFSLEPREPIYAAAGLMSACGEWVFRLASARPEILDAVEAALSDPGSPGGRALAGLLGPRAELVDVAREPLPADRRVFRAQPILVFAREGEGPWAFLRPDHEGFPRAVAAALARRWEFWCGRKWVGRIEFSFAERPRQKLIQFRGRGLMAWAGLVRLEAPAPMRMFAQCVGLGHKPSAGLGMLV